MTSLTRPAVAERWILRIAVATLLERLIIPKTKGTPRPAMSKRVYKFTSAYYGKRASIRRSALACRPGFKDCLVAVYNGRRGHIRATPV